MESQDSEPNDNLSRPADPSVYQETPASLPPTTPPPPGSSPLPAQAENKKIFRKFMKIGLIASGVIIGLSLLAFLVIYFLPKGESKDEVSVTHPNFSQKEQQKTTVEPTGSPESLASKYEIDTDGDSVPDFVEEALGTDSQKDECAFKVGCGDVGEIKEKEVNILFILDSSGSMAGNVPGGQKMAVAREAMKRYIDQLPETIKAGLMVYGHKGSNSTTDKAVSCAGIELLYPIQKVDKTTFKTKVDSFQPTGWTPIADSFDQARQAFANQEDQVNKIVLVSDGIETCGGDPCAVAGKLSSLGIGVVVDVIGFDVDQAAKVQLECVADASGGQYFDASTADEFKAIFEQLGERSQELAEAGGCLAKNLADYTGCLTSQLQQAIAYLNDLNSDLLENNPNSPEQKQVMNTIRKMTKEMTDLIRKSTEQTGEGFDEILQRAKDLQDQYSSP